MRDLASPFLGNTKWPSQTYLESTLVGALKRHESLETLMKAMDIKN